METLEKESTSNNLPEESFFYDRPNTTIRLGTIFFGICFLFFTRTDLFSIKTLTFFYTYLVESTSHLVENLFQGQTDVAFGSFLFIIITIMITLTTFMFMGEILKMIIIAFSKKPQLKFSKEGLLTQRYGLLKWETISHIMVDEDIHTDKYEKEYTLRTLSIFFVNASPIEIDLDDYKNVTRIKKLTEIYDTHYKKEASSKYRDIKALKSKNFKPELFTIVIFILLMVMIFVAILNGVYAIFFS